MKNKENKMVNINENAKSNEKKQKGKRRNNVEMVKE